MEKRQFGRRIAGICCVLLLCAASQSLSQQPTRPEVLQTAAQARETLESLQIVDDLPLYRMKFVGNYDRLQGARERTEKYQDEQAKQLRSNASPRSRPRQSGVVPAANPAGFACSLFVAHGRGGAPLFGRNFDWLEHPAMVLWTDPADGYAAISLVDISYLGYAANDGQLETIEGRRGLLTAPLIPFDGMNEAGLTIGMAAVPETQMPFDADKPTFHGLGIIRVVLDQAKTVDEAIALFAEFNIVAEGGPHIHYLVADAHGASALIELKDGVRHVFRNESPWQVATNFYYCGNEEDPNSQCHRYARIARRLRETKGELSLDAAFELLRGVAQPHTRWSAVYDAQNQKLSLATSKRFDRIHQFELNESGQQDLD